jgi:hypothetical protein
MGYGSSNPAGTAGKYLFHSPTCAAFSSEVERLAIKPDPFRAYQVEEQPIAQKHKRRASKEQGEGTRTELAAGMLAEVVWP